MSKPDHCQGKCVNAPEGEPPFQSTFNMICEGCRTMTTTMSGPLTEECDGFCDCHCVELAAALARLDYLERKVQAAERLADAAHNDNVLKTHALWRSLRAYDEVTE